MWEIVSFFFIFFLLVWKAVTGRRRRNGESRMENYLTAGMYIVMVAIVTLLYIEGRKGI
jgi:hypothetical protein